MFRSLFARVFGNTGKPPLPLSYCWHPSCFFYDDVHPFFVVSIFAFAARCSLDRSVCQKVYQIRQE
ncbi:hypothetical protein GE21DRAFT_1024983 [Neurospora crassa]|nr:hypothetical protein GE21DRAFT_1024983 [Neurospora crassa]